MSSKRSVHTKRRIKKDPRLNPPQSWDSIKSAGDFLIGGYENGGGPMLAGL